MKTITAIEWINKNFTNAEIIVKDMGNTGYYIKEGYYDVRYIYVRKSDIIYSLNKYQWYGCNSRQKKLYALKIMTE